ncbi:MAG: hypothetical protein WCR95_06565 [Eubacteriales bacterium]
MDEFLSWFYAFMNTMLVDGVWKVISNFFKGLFQIFNFPAYFEQLSRYSEHFSILEWVAAILSFVIVYSIWFIIVFLLVLLSRKYIRFRSSIVSNDDLLEELSDLHRDVIRLTREKERILALKIGYGGVSLEQINAAIAETAEGIGGAELQSGESVKAAQPGAMDESRAQSNRFFRLSAVDQKYEEYIPPQYNNQLNLKEICEDFRNFCCSRMRLFYDEKVIRLMFAGLAATKLILIQGISGTGKTSLPYAMGKYFQNDATICSVQPAWRDRSELLGFFNEFTKKFNETEFLKQVYEASYNDDINVIVLDEMNIARVEYYFAEMLSILEMPDPNEWKLELVPSTWPGDPKRLGDGKLKIPQNVWYIGTANNDDSTFTVSDKVYDRALTINLDSKGLEFDAPDTPPKQISYTHVSDLYEQALSLYPVDKKHLDNISKLDMYVIQKFRVAFGNRILKQLSIFVPAYVAAGGSELEGIDYMLATKVFRKFESLNLSLIRDEIRGLISFMDAVFGKGEMKESIAYLERLQKTY